MKKENKENKEKKIKLFITEDKYSDGKSKFTICQRVKWGKRMKMDFPVSDEFDTIDQARFEMENIKNEPKLVETIVHK